MVVKVQVPDFSNLVELATERATKVAVSNLQEQAVTNSPADTGNLRRNIVADFQNDEVRAQANYSAAVEYGFPAKTVRAKNAKALRFEKDGKVIFAKSVNLPARAPNPFMRLAGRKVQNDIPSIFKRELDKLK